MEHNQPTVAITTIKAHLTALEAYLTNAQRDTELLSIRNLIQRQMQALPAATRVPVSDVARNLDLIADWLNEPYLGLQLAPYSSRHHPHLSYFFGQSDFPLRDYLQILRRYISLSTQVMTLTVSSHPHELLITFEPVQGLRLSVHQHEGFAAAVADAVYRSYGLRPTAVTFQHDRLLPHTRDRDLFQQVFGVEPGFRQATTTMSFPLQAETALRHEGQRLHRLQRLEALNHKAFPEESWADRCRFLLRLLMYCGEPQKDILAGILSVTPRTLQRRLEAEQTTFRTLLNDLRKEMAEDYLTEGKLSHEEITFLLGFQDRGVFYRAFRQWFNMTPGEFGLKLATVD